MNHNYYYYPISYSITLRLKNNFDISSFEVLIFYFLTISLHTNFKIPISFPTIH